MNHRLLFKKITFLYPVLRYKISGESMLPAYSSGETVIGYRWFRKLHVHDVIIIRDPRNGKLLVKRIHRIKDTAYFVVGDNSGKSTDSRQFGWIYRNHIEAKVLPLSK